MIFRQIRRNPAAKPRNRAGILGIRGSVFRRLHLLFIAAMVLIYVSILSLFGLYLRKLQELQALNLRTSVRQEAVSLEELLENTYQMERNILRDDRIERLAMDMTMNGYEVSRTVSEMNDIVIGFEAMNTLAERISVLIPARAMAISSERGYTRFEYVPHMRAQAEAGVTTTRKLLYVSDSGNEDLPPDGGDPDDKSGEDREVSLLPDDAEIYMELLFPMSFSLDEKFVPDYGVRTRISRAYLKERLAVFLTETEQGAFYVLGEGGDTRFVLPEGQEIASDILKGWLDQRDDLSGETGAGSFAGRGDARDYWYVTFDLESYGLTLVAYLSKARMLKVFLLPLMGVSVLILVISALFISMLRHTNRRVSQPLNKIAEAFEQVGGGNLSVRLYHRPNDEFHFIYEAFNSTVGRIQELIEDVKEQSRLLKNAELIQLQSQINPHFLYNSFLLIRIMAKNEDNDQIMTFVTSLAKYYRFLTRETENTVTLEREAEHMHNYVDIQQMRFGDKIKVDIEPVPPALCQVRVPKLILQPLLENAYNYGMKKRLDGGLIRVRYLVENDERPLGGREAEEDKAPLPGNEFDGVLHVIVEDNGGELDSAELETIRANVRDYQGRAAGHALTNIDRRLKLTYGEASGLEIKASGLGGLRVELVICAGQETVLI